MAECGFKGCTAEIKSDSKTGVCRNHFHSNACRCVQCRGERPKYRAKTVEQMEREGLLPRKHKGVMG